MSLVKIADVIINPGVTWWRSFEQLSHSADATGLGAFFLEPSGEGDRHQNIHRYDLRPFSGPHGIPRVLASCLASALPARPLGTAIHQLDLASSYKAR
jgi:hypothetical protein